MSSVERAGPRNPTKIRDWRKYRGMSLTELSERMGDNGFPFSVGQLSRLERGETPYGQDHLEALSKSLNCSIADLIERAPEDSSTVLSLWAQLDADGQSKVSKLIRGILGGK